MSFAQVRRLVSLALLGIFASPLLAQPAITGLQPADGSLLSARTGTLSGQAVDAILLRVDGVELTLGAGGSFSYAFDLPEGESALSIYAEDAGGATSQVHHLEVDTLAPGIVVSSPAQTRVGASPVFVAGTVQEPHLQSVTVRGSPATLNGNSFSSSITLNEGAQNIAIVATDTLGHSSTSTLVLTLDTQAPAISVNESGAPFTGGLFDRPLTPQITITDAGTYTSEILLDGSPYVSGTPIGQEGSHQLAISATDAVGNTSSRDISFTLDFTAPVFGQITPAAGALIAQATVTLQVEATGATSVKVGSLTGSAAGNLYTIGPIALVEGSQELVIEAFDAVGNRAERRHALLRDTTAPTLSIVSPAEGAVLTSLPAVVSGQALDPRLASVRVGGELASLSGSTFSISKALTEGSNSFLVEALDSAGNSATQTLNLTLDTTAPSFVVKVNGLVLAGGEVYSAAITPTLELSEPSATVTATLDGSSFTFGSAISVDGNHQLSVTVTHNNLSSSNLFSFRIDRQAPSFPSLEPAEGTVLAATSLLLEGRVQGATSLTIDGVPVALQGEVFTAGPYTLSAGSRTFELIATSAGGLQTTLSRTVVQDSVPPQLVVQQPAEGALLGSANTAVSGTATDPHLLRVRVSGVDAQVSASSFYASGVSLAEGSNTLTVVAEDRAGNQQQATRTVVRDTLDPEVAITDPVAGTVVPAASYVVRGSASDAHLDRVEVNGRRATLAAGDFSLSVSLAEGSNSIEAVAFDRLGHSKTTTVTISRDSAAPQITIQDPPEGFATQAATLTVRGAYEDEPGTTVKVNGLVAVLTSGHFEVAGIELLPGENRITARATDAQGNEGVHTRTVVRDQVAPTFVRLEPAAGALALPLATVFTLSFSEEMAPPAEGAITLATAGGTQLAFSAVVQGKDVVLTPQALLPPETTLVLTLTAGLVDLAGNAMSPLPAPFELTTVDTGAPGAPVLTATPVAAACRHDIELTGTAESLSQVRVQGGAAAALTRADEAGAFTLLVELLPEQLNVLHVVAIDVLGNISPELVLELAADCAPPQVLGATLVGDTVSVTFSEAVNAPASAFALISPSGPETFGFAASGATATLTLSAAPSGLLELAVGEGATTGISDLAGNAMSYPWHHLFGAGAGDSFLAGTVFDDGKGQPLRGVLVSVTATNGVSLGDPLPQQTTTDDGRFLLGLPVGTHDVTFARPGYAPVFRVVTTASGEGTHVFDPRLTLLNLPQAIGSVGGEVVAGAARLAVPAGALASSQATSLTELSEQALPALLPYGYSPRGAVYVSIDASFAAPATLTLPIDTLIGREVVIASLDFALLQWKAIEVRTVSGQTLDIAISAPGAYVAVEADSESAALLVPVLGQVLPSLPAPAGDEVTSADIDFAPTLVLPSQRSLATVSYTLASAGTPAPSGMPLTLSVQERLTLLDGSERRAVPYSADLLVFRSPAGNARSRFWLQPSPLAASLPIEIGAEDVSVRTFGATTVRGNILGPDGGSVLGVSGDVFEVPAGALSQPTAVVVTRRTVADLSHPAPAGFPVLGVIEVDLGGAQLAGIGSLTLATETPPTAGSRGILLGTVEVDGEPRWRALAELEPVAAGWRTVSSGGSNPPWPGIRQGGLYLALELEGDWGLLEGVLYDSDQNLVAGGLISSVSVPWIQLSGSNGSYVIPLPAGAAVVVAARDLRYDQVAVEIPALTDGERRVFDLEVLPTGPTVIEIEPADGAANVPTTFLPRVKFSEPVDRSTLAAGIRLTKGGEPVAIELDHQGNEVFVDPVASLIPDTTYQLEIGTEVSDLQGRLLSSPRSVSFRTTAAPPPAPGINASKLRLYEPDYQGMAQIVGLPGAVPADSTMWIENVETTTVVSGADGSFLLEVPATVGDTLFLTVLIPGQSAATQVLGPWLLRGDVGAWVGASGGSFKTALGIDVTVERGTFAAITKVALTAKPAPIATTSRLSVLLDFELDLGGAVAQKSILVRIPAPSGSQVSSTYLLNRYTEALGRRGWMAMDLLRLEGGSLTNATFGAVTGSVVARSSVSSQVSASRFTVPSQEVLSEEDMLALRKGGFLPQASRAIEQLAAVSFSPRGLEVAPRASGVSSLVGVRLGGRYQIARSNQLMGWIDVPAAQEFVAISSLSDGPPFIAKVFAELEATVERLRIPAFPDSPTNLVVLDLGTGYEVYREILPPSPDPVVNLPPDVVSDHQPPLFTAGSPVKFFVLQTSSQGLFDVATKISSEIANQTLTVTGNAGAASPNAQVKLFGLDNSEDALARALSDGSFSVSVPLSEPGKRFLLVVGGKVGPSERLKFHFSEMVRELRGIEIYALSETGAVAASPTEIRTQSFDNGTNWEIVPASGWRAGKHLLRVTTAFSDDSGNAWPRTLEIELEVPRSSSISSISSNRFADFARIGNILAVADNDQGLRLFDVSNPAAPANFLAGSQGYQFADGGSVRGVAADSHGRLVVVGSGEQSGGQLHVLDPMAMDRENSNLSAVYADSVWGYTSISNHFGVQGPLPATGLARSVTVLNRDRVLGWTYGDAPPEGISVAAGPSSIPDEVLLTISGDGERAHGPVSLRNLTQGLWRREFADSASSFSLQIRAAPGDVLQLQMEQGAWAYATIDDYGIAAVDVEAIRGGIGTEIQALSVADFTRAYDLSREPVCDPSRPSVNSTPTELRVLASGSGRSLVTMVQGFGIVLYNISSSSPGQLSRLSTACAAVGGEAFVTGMDLAAEYPLDLNGDGQVQTQDEVLESGEIVRKETRDYVVLAHAKGWVLIFDLTNPEHPVLVGKIKIGKTNQKLQISGVSVDRQNQRIYVGAFGSGLYVVDFSRPPSLNVIDQDHDLVDDRIVENIQVGTDELADTLAMPEVGVIWGGGRRDGVSGISVSGPSVRVVSGDGGPRREVRRLAPFGVPTALEGPTSALYPALFQIVVSAASAEVQLRIDLSSRGPNGSEMDSFGETEGAPQAALSGQDALVLRRLGDKPWERGASLYASSKVVAIADTRASINYDMEPIEEGQCNRCDQIQEGVYPAPPTLEQRLPEILSGQSIEMGWSESTLPLLKGTYGDFLDRVGEIASTKWERSKPTQQGSPQATSSMAPGVGCDSGEVKLSVMDAHLGSRGFDLDFVRKYRSQSLGDGPLGPGWDHNFDVRLRELPNKAVELMDGSGRRDTFDPNSSGGYETPTGRFGELQKTSNGFTLTDPSRNVLRFDGSGRLSSLADSLRRDEGSGSELTFNYDAHSRLTEVKNSLGRSLSLEYNDEGRIRQVSDSTGRTWDYSYDSQGQLTSVLSPPVDLGGGYQQRIEQSYSYVPSSQGGDLRTRLNGLGQLKTVNKPDGTPLLDFSYADSNGDGLAEEVQSQQVGGRPIGFAWDLNSRVATVTDSRGGARSYQFNNECQPTRIENEAGAAWNFQYNGDGLLQQTSTPLGAVHENVFQGGEDPRSRGNLIESRVWADARGGNGSPLTLITRYGYDAATNQLASIVDPRGNATSITRDDAGLPVLIARAPYTEDQIVESFKYNEFGQKIEQVDGRGAKTVFTYYVGGPAEGFLHAVEVDPAGVGVLMVQEVDERGRVRATIDPNGVRSEMDYNDLGWLLRSRRAVTGAGDLAPPLGHETRRIYDLEGQLREVQVPYGDGNEFTRQIFDYGQLGELRLTRTEPMPGTEDLGLWVAESRDYDENLNLVSVTNGEGNQQVIEYDARNLPSRITRGLGFPSLAQPIVEDFIYDAEGQVTSWADGRGKVWQQFYDGYSRPSRKVDPLGNSSWVEYDANSNPVAEHVLDPNAELLARSLSEYDRFDRRKAVKQILWDPSEPIPTQRELTTYFTYDAASNLRTVTDAEGRLSQQISDLAGRPVEVQDAAGNLQAFEYDRSGNVTKTTDFEQSASGPVAIETKYRYDAGNRMVASIDALGNTRQYQFDARDQLVRSIDEENFFTTYEYDGLDRPIHETKPEGIEVFNLFDKANRLVEYRDAKDQATRYEYDAVDRLTKVTYADNKFETSTFDATGNLIEHVDQLGTRVVSTYDDANRLLSRVVESADPNVEGPFSETYAWDGLGRLVRGQNGSVIVERTYDSLSRMLSERGPAGWIRYEHDDVGNTEKTTYPSGFEVTRTFDDLNRPSQIRGDTLLTGAFEYRRQGLLEKLTLGNGLVRQTTFDAISRPLENIVQKSGSAAVLAESLAWTPKSFKAATGRGDKNRVGKLFSYDGAGRIVGIGEKPEALAGIANNSVLSLGLVAGAPKAETFEYDVAQNLLRKTVRENESEVVVDTPPDASGRNRPASIDGVPLEWDDNGSLLRKGDLQFRYDWRNRLKKVLNATSGQLVATYEYDVFNRRVKKEVGGQEYGYTWDGWQQVEDSLNGPLQTTGRRIPGLALDQYLRLDMNLGSPLEQHYVPVYDSTNNLVAITSSTGKPIERYEYSAYGLQRIFVDSTPPEITQIRKVGNTFYLEMSEEVSLAEIEKQIAEGNIKLAGTGIGLTYPLTATQPVQEGPQARRRVALATGAEIGDAQEVTLTVGADSLVDSFLNTAPSVAKTESLIWSTDGVLEDTTSPRIERIAIRFGRVEIDFSEAVELGAASQSISIDGVVKNWSLDPTGYRLTLTESLEQGEHVLSVGTSAIDLAAKGLPVTFQQTLTIGAQDFFSAFEVPNPRELTSSSAGNSLGFHGQSKEVETGLLYIRNRYYDADLGSFVTADPLGFLGGPSQYAYANSNPINTTDAMGLCPTLSSEQIEANRWANEDPSKYDGDFLLGACYDGPKGMVTSLPALGSIMWSCIEKNNYNCRPREFIAEVGRSIWNGIVAGFSERDPKLSARFRGELFFGVLAPELMRGRAPKMLRDIPRREAFEFSRLNFTLDAAAPLDVGPVALFRGTSEGFAGNAGLQRIGVTPASSDPLVATLFATQSEAFGKGVVQIAMPSDLDGVIISKGNVLASLEREVAVEVLPLEFASRAGITITSAQARQILAEMGFVLPKQITSITALSDFLKSLPRLTPEQIEEFVKKAKNVED